MIKKIKNYLRYRKYKKALPGFNNGDIGYWLNGKFISYDDFTYSNIVCKK